MRTDIYNFVVITFAGGTSLRVVSLDSTGKLRISAAEVRILKPARSSGTSAVIRPLCRVAVLLDSISRLAGPCRMTLAPLAKVISASPEVSLTVWPAAGSRLPW